MLKVTYTLIEPKKRKSRASTISKTQKEFIYISGLNGKDNAEKWQEYFKDYFKNSKIHFFTISLPESNEHLKNETTPVTKQTAEYIQKFMKENNINTELPIMAHGVGGRIAVYLNVTYGIGTHLIIFGTRFFKRTFLREKIFLLLKKSTLTKPLARLILPARFATDWQTQLILSLRDEDISDLLSQIEVPTLLIWGEADITSPLVNGIEAHKKIKNSMFRVITDGNETVPFKPVPDALKQLIFDFIK